LTQLRQGVQVKFCVFKQLVVEQTAGLIQEQEFQGVQEETVRHILRAVQRGILVTAGMDLVLVFQAVQVLEVAQAGGLVRVVAEWVF